ncbi:unnamed protein product [Effrenium voratum]|nr:unnamed protein product [Effrenium voratum]
MLRAALLPFLVSEASDGKVRVPGIGAVMLLPEELSLLHSSLEGKSSYFEFGSGASTVHVAARFPDLRIVSVDTDAAWSGTVQRHRWLRANGSSGSRVRVRHVDLGPVQAFGYPLQNLSYCTYLRRRCLVLGHQGSCIHETCAKREFVGLRSTWPRFSDAVLEEMPRGGWDVVMVDARFRVACALKSLQALKPNGLVLVHDWQDGRGYEEIQNYARLEMVIKSLALFRPLKSADQRQRHAARRFEYTPG